MNQCHHLALIVAYSGEQPPFLSQRNITSLARRTENNCVTRGNTMDLMTLIERVLTDRSVNFSITFSRGPTEKPSPPAKAVEQQIATAPDHVDTNDVADAFALLTQRGMPENDDTLWLARCHGSRVVRKCIEKMDATKAKKPIADEPAYLRTCLKNIERKMTK